MGWVTERLAQIEGADHGAAKEGRVKDIHHSALQQRLRTKNGRDYHMFGKSHIAPREVQNHLKWLAAKTKQCRHPIRMSLTPSDGIDHENGLTGLFDCIHMFTCS